MSETVREADNSEVVIASHRPWKDWHMIMGWDRLGVTLVWGQASLLVRDDSSSSFVLQNESHFFLWALFSFFRYKYVFLGVKHLCEKDNSESSILIQKYNLEKKPWWRNTSEAIISFFKIYLDLENKDRIILNILLCLEE